MSILENDSNTQVAEDNYNYFLGKEHDRIFRTLLDNKKDTAKFINKILNTNVKEDNLEKYNSSFVSKIFQNQEADIVYKLKNNNIFFLIEHQSKIDYSMSYRILEYEIEIIKSAVDIQKMKNKSYKFPLVIPIVLYTGKQKWNANKILEEGQEKIEGINIKLSNYNLVDVNDYTEKELLEDETLLTKMMLIEKTNSSNEIEKILEKIIPKIKEEDKEIMSRIIGVILSSRLGDAKANEYIKNFEGDGENMLAVVEMLEKENQRYIEIRKERRKKRRKRDWKDGKKYRNCKENA